MNERSSPRNHHRPALPGAGYFEAVVGGTDPALVSEAADRAATLLVRGPHVDEDPAVVDRVVRLAETEGLETLADLWSGSPADSLAGCLWRLYLLRTWVYADPVAAAREFDLGRIATPVHEVVAGVVEPPGPDQVRALADEVLRGVVRGDFADTLFRAAAFARVAAVGRARAGTAEGGLGGAGEARTSTYSSDLTAARLLALAEQLEKAGHLELAGALA